MTLTPQKKHGKWDGCLWPETGTDPPCKTPLHEPCTITTERQRVEIRRVKKKNQQVSAKRLANGHLDTFSVSKRGGS